MLLAFSAPGHAPAADSAAGSRVLAERNPLWSGPVTGPRAQPRKVIAILAEDLRNGGVLGVAQGVREAAREIGWRVRIFDAGGTAAGRRRSVAHAAAVEPDGLVLCGSDALEMDPILRASSIASLPLVAWHSGPRPGPIAHTSVAMNVTTDPLEVARVTAEAAIAQSGGRAGVVIFTDSLFGIATAKANAMAGVIRNCAGCKLLSVEDVPISQSAQRTPEVVRRLLADHGTRWTHALAINDVYFDHAVPVFLSAGLDRSAISLISAGDGSAPALARVRAGVYQTGTVAEPLNMQGWQIVDEMNRLLAGQPVTGFVAPPHLVTARNAATEGGSLNAYDPANGYRDAYRRIWSH
jgi:ribose transport system substrate-binding protein